MSVVCTWLSFVLAVQLLLVFAVYSQSGPPTANASVPYWLVDAPFQHLKLGAMPSTVNITVIGAGMSGASTIFHLMEYLNAHEMSMTVLLLDARGASGGATGRNGGGLGVSGYSTFHSTLNKYGKQSAVDRYNFTLQTVNDIRAIVQSHSDTVDTIQTGYSMSPITDENNVPAIQLQMNEFANNCGFDNCLNSSIVSAADTIKMAHTFDTSVTGWQSSVINGNQSFFWPAKVVFALVNDSIKLIHHSSDKNDHGNHNDDGDGDGDGDDFELDLNIQFETVVHSVTSVPNTKQWSISVMDAVTQQTANIISDVVVFATNAYTSYLLPEYANRITPAKNQVIMSDAWPDFIWADIASGFGDDYEYWTQRIQNNQILIGGGRNNVSDANNDHWIGDYNDSSIDKGVSVYLQQYMSTLFPEIANSSAGEIAIQIEWQGVMGFSSDNVPWIGPLLEADDNRYICAGFTGGGMDYAFGGGKAVASMIVGQKPQNFADIFLPYYPGR